MEPGVGEVESDTRATATSHPWITQMLKSIDPRFTQFGCGLCAPREWLNFDASPTMLLQHLPLAGGLVPSGPYGRFPNNVKYGNIVRGLPIPSNSVELLYCSHVLEHLCCNELRQALRNCHRILSPNGTFRLVVPDLEYYAKQYINSLSHDAACEFMRQTSLGKEDRSHSLIGLLRECFGGSQHLWMWDYKSLAFELNRAGFREIRRASIGDSGMQPFNHVEKPHRWQDALGIQCSK